MKKNVLITGASGNLGKATVEKFLADGYRVLATYSPGRKPDLGEGDIALFEADLTDENKVSDLIAGIVTQHKHIDAALLLVGGFAMGGIKETDGAALKKMYTLNFETAYYVARPVFQVMQAQSSGRIVLVGARPALIAKAGKGVLAYALSKSLLFRLAEFLNAEADRQDIVTSVIVPSTIDTPDNRKSMPDADYTSWVKPEEIAETMAFICRSKSLREPVYKIYGNS